MKHAQLSRELSEIRDEINLIEGTKTPAKGSEKEAESDALKRFLTGGSSALDSTEQEQYIREGEGKEVFELSQEASRSDNETAKAITDDTVQRRVLETLDYFGGISMMAQVFNTPDGNELRVPTQDAAEERGKLIAEQDAEIEEQRIKNFADIVFGAQTMTTNSIPITRELLTLSLIHI